MSSHRSPTVLIIDDTEQNRYVLSAYLRRAGFGVLEAATVEEGVKLIQQNPVAVILDITLPDGDGFTLCRKFKSDPRTGRIPIILSSATFTRTQDKVLGLDGGADGYLTTPIQADEFIATLRSILRVREAEARAQSAQERLSLAQEAAQIETFEWLIQEDRVLWTEEMARIYGLEQRDIDSTFGAWLNRIDARDRDRVKAEIERALEKGGKFQTEFRIVHPDGMVRWVLLRAKIYQDDDNTAVRMLGINMDHTERKRIEEALEKVQEELRLHVDELELRVQERTAQLTETVDDLESFSYSITHDMRAPLRAMQGFSTLLLQDCADRLGAEGCGYLRRISDASIRLDKLIQDVLSYSRVVKSKLELEPIDVEKLIGSIIEAYPPFQKPSADVRIEGQLPLVLANEAALTQCISNLLGNAVKFVMPGQTPLIRIYAETEPAWVRIWFEDNGIGIEPRHHARIFQMFERVAGSDEFEGTGIGLTIVRKGVHRMGGQVGVLSGLGQGSRFWIQLKNANSVEAADRVPRTEA